MTNGDGAQQSTVVERLIRLEVQTSANNQRITENTNILLEAIRETNRRVDETNNRLDRQVTELRREFNKLTFLILGTGAAVIATIIGGLLLT